MRLNLLIGVGPERVSPRRGEGRSSGVPAPWGPPRADFEPEEGRDNIRTTPRSGKKHPGDPRQKLSATRLISGEYLPSYMVNSSSDQYVPKTIEDTMNPDVSGFTSRTCRSPPRNTSVGDESFRAALDELKCGSKR